jgi:hypothetical protein
VRSCRRRQQLRQPRQIVDGGPEAEGASDAIASSKLGLLQSGDHLDSTEGFFDSLAGALTGGVAGMGRRATIDRRRAPVGIRRPCGVTLTERNLLTRSSASSALSAPCVIACCRSARGSIMPTTAMRSACPRLASNKRQVRLAALGILMHSQWNANMRTHTIYGAPGGRVLASIKLPKLAECEK